MTTTRARHVDVPAEAAFRRLDDETERGWLELWDRTGAPPWLHPTWTRLWWASFGAGRLTLACVRRGRRLVAVAPTAIVRGEVRALANGHSPAWDILAEDQGGAVDAARALVGTGLPLDLFPVRADDATASAVERAAAGARYATATRPLGLSPTIEIRLGEEPPSAPARRRREIRRRWRRLGEDGPVSVEVRSDTGDGGSVLERCVRVEALGWKGREGTAIARDDATHRFYRALAEWAASTGWLRIAEVRLDATTIAFDLSIETGGVHYLLKTGFDPAYARCAPGALLRDAMIGRAFAIGLRRYEFLGKLDDWKREWTETGHEILQIRAFPPTIAGAARRAAFAGAWAVRARITRT